MRSIETGLLQPGAVFSALVALSSIDGDFVACSNGRDVLAVRGQVDAGTDAPGLDVPLGDPVTLEVALDRRLRNISPLIYGMDWNVHSATGAMPSHRATLLHYASFWLTAYNWEINAGNGGATWCYENGSFTGGAQVGEAFTKLVAQAKATNAAALVSIPIGPYVAADAMSGSAEPDCSGNVRTTPDYLNKRFRQNRPKKSGALANPPDLTDAFVYQDEFTSWLRATAGTTPAMVVLDFYPERWQGIFPHLHPDPLTYDELASRNVNFAAGAKAAWPQLPVISSTVSSWAGLLNLNDSANTQMFLEYFLDELAKAETAQGRRVVDHLGVGLGPTLPSDSTGADNVRAARLQSTRSLWDPTYDEKTWVTAQVGGPLRLIPRLKEAIARKYPDTGIAFNPWNFGSDTTIEGAIVAADALGIFGREGVAAAISSVGNGEGAFRLAGFLAFRSYDRNDGAFGDIALEASSSDLARFSVYASADSTDPNRFVLIAINRSDAAAEVDLHVAGGPAFADALVYRVTAAEAAPVADPAPLPATAPDRFHDIVPALSIAVYVPRRAP